MYLKRRLYKHGGNKLITANNAHQTFFRWVIESPEACCRRNRIASGRNMVVARSESWHLGRKRSSSVAAAVPSAVIGNNCRCAPAALEGIPSG